jgi:hypothetical protein
VVLDKKHRDFTFGFMGTPDLTLYNNLRRKFGDQETQELVEFIHSEVKAEMEIVKSNLDTKSNFFLTKEDKADLIDRIDITRSDLTDRINITKGDLIDRIHRVKMELIVWIVGVSLLQYILLMITRKFF